jgi:AraC-like DNA-binding protein
MIFDANFMARDAKSGKIVGMSAQKSAAEFEVSVSVLKQMFLYLDSLDVDREAFLRSLGLDPALADSPDAYLSLETYLLIQDQAAEYTSDPYFGLHMGEYAEAGSWSILGYLMANCDTLGEAFQKSGRYQRIIGNLITGEPKLEFNKIKVIYDTPAHAPRMSRHCFEAAFSSGVRIMRSLTGKDLSPMEVTFIYPEPASREEYERVFRCPVIFNHKHNSMTISPGIINTPIQFSNPGLKKYFDNYAQEFLVELDARNEHTNQVTRIILSNLDDESLTIKKVAREMAVSVRTLQNRLSDEGVAFSELLLEIRERLAKKYLRQDYTVEEITYLLGYSEPSVFRRAFKQWSGFTPSQFRDAALSAGSSP